MRIILNEDLFPVEEEPVKEIENKTEETPSGPDIGADTTVADMIITAINDEWKTIQYYNSLIEALHQAGQDEMIPVIEDINNEEHKHVGQLQECLKVISPNTHSIASGEQEGEEQLSEKEGVEQLV